MIDSSARKKTPQMGLLPRVALYLGVSGTIVATLFFPMRHSYSENKSTDLFISLKQAMRMNDKGEFETIHTYYDPDGSTRTFTTRHKDIWMRKDRHVLAKGSPNSPENERYYQENGINGWVYSIGARPMGGKPNQNQRQYFVLDETLFNRLDVGKNYHALFQKQTRQGRIRDEYTFTLLEASPITPLPPKPNQP